MFPNIFATNDLNNPRGKHWHPDTPGNRTTRHRHATNPRHPGHGYHSTREWANTAIPAAHLIRRHQLETTN